MLTMNSDFQKTFFAKAGPNLEILREMADAVPNVYFNIIDNGNRIVAFSRANCRNCNFTSEAEVIGLKLTDLFAPILAEAYISLYAKVRETGVAVRNQLTAYAADRSTDLRIVSVFPIRDRRGMVIGTAAFYRPVASSDLTQEWYGALKKTIAFIDGNFQRKIPLSTLAVQAGMGLSTFRRVFTETLGLSPGEYISTIRINHARKLLSETSLSLEQIASECGFYDQSHFMKIFKKLRHQTPKEYRRSSFRSS